MNRLPMSATHKGKNTRLANLMVIVMSGVLGLLIALL